MNKAQTSFMINEPMCDSITLGVPQTNANISLLVEMTVTFLLPELIPAGFHMKELHWLTLKLLISFEN